MTRLTADLFPRRGRHPNRKTSEYSAIYRRVGLERGLRCVIGVRPGRACKYNCQAEGLNVYAARATGFRWDGCTSHHGQHARPVYPDRPMAYQLAF
jgi:hypothetical protein